MEKARYECDLHCHTTRSDGADTPRELIDRAAERGIAVLAITDHDIVPPSCVWLAETGEEVSICEYATAKGIRLLPGIEISCETEVEDVHIVCFGCDWQDEYFRELQAHVVNSKVQGYKRLAEMLREGGMDITWEEVLDNGGNPIAEAQVQKKMMFELLARKGYAPDWSAAKLMVKNTPRYQVRREKPEPAAVIREVHRCAGRAILAHPFLINEDICIRGQRMTREEYIEQLIDAGLDGIEACYPYDKTSYDGDLGKEAIEAYVRRQYQDRLAVISGGSDYHADHKKGVKESRELGECGVTAEYFRSNAVLQEVVRSLERIT